MVTTSIFCMANSLVVYYFSEHQNLHFLATKIILAQEMGSKMHIF